MYCFLNILGKNSVVMIPQKINIQRENKPKVLRLKQDSLSTRSNQYGIRLPRKKKFNSKDILRIHSQLIRGFINGSIESAEAKTLSGLCANYIQALQQAEIEERLKAIEEKINEKL